MTNMHTQISLYRKKLGITQEELAERVNVSRQTVIALEAGRYNPSLGLAYAITKALEAKRIEDIFIFK